MNNHQSISHFQRLRADASGCQGDESRRRHNDEETAPASVFHTWTWNHFRSLTFQTMINGLISNLFQSNLCLLSDPADSAERLNNVISPNLRQVI